MYLHRRDPSSGFSTARTLLSAALIATVALPVAWDVGAVSFEPDSGNPMSFLCRIRGEPSWNTQKRQLREKPHFRRLLQFEDQDKYGLGSTWKLVATHICFFAHPETSPSSIMHYQCIILNNARLCQDGLLSYNVSFERTNC